MEDLSGVWGGVVRGILAVHATNLVMGPHDNTI